MNKKIVLYIAFIVLLIVTIVFVAINDSQKSKIEIDEQKKIDELNKAIEDEITKNINNIQPNPNINKREDDENSSNQSTEKEDVIEEDEELTHSDITGNFDEIQYTENLFNSSIEESLNSLTNENVMDVVDLLESKLVSLTGMNDSESQKVFNLRDRLNNMKTVYENHSDLSSSFVNPDLDFNYIVMTNRTIPFKEFVLPYTFSIQHEVIVHAISSPESLLPFVVEDDEISFGEIKDYELDTLYELKGMYGQEAKTYIQDFTLNGDKLYAILLSHKDGFMIYKIVNNSNGEITKNPLIDYGTVTKWKKFYSGKK